MKELFDSITVEKGVKRRSGRKRSVKLLGEKVVVLCSGEIIYRRLATENSPRFSQVLAASIPQNSTHQATNLFENCKEICGEH